MKLCRTDEQDITERPDVKTQDWKVDLRLTLAYAKCVHRGGGGRGEGSGIDHEARLEWQLRVEQNVRNFVRPSEFCCLPAVSVLSPFLPPWPPPDFLPGVWRAVLPEWWSCGSPLDLSSVRLPPERRGLAKSHVAWILSPTFPFRFQVLLQRLTSRADVDFLLGVSALLETGEGGRVSSVLVVVCVTLFHFSFWYVGVCLLFSQRREHWRPWDRSLNPLCWLP